MNQHTVLLSPMCNGVFIRELEQEFTGDYFEMIERLGKIFCKLVMTNPEELYAIQISDLNSSMVYYYESGNIYNSLYRKLKPCFRYSFSDN